MRSDFCVLQPVVLPAEMPIASGAAGRMDVGVDLGGHRTKTKPANGNCDSYLQRYQELQERKRHKSNMMQVTQDETEPCKGAKEGSPQKKSSSEDHTSEGHLRGQRSRTSPLCVLL
ncbi:uncharacterized protein AB9W97_013707 [Spinachia spinachia]